MKRAILILLTMLAAQAATVAHAETTYTVVLAGGAAQNMIHIWLSPDGSSYVIDSAVPLEVGGTVCENTPEMPTQLTCKAPLVAGFEVNGGESDDSVSVASTVALPVTMRGGPGNDSLVGGNGPDKLIGGEGNDKLAGRGGDDVLYGGAGADELFGGSGSDVLRGGPLDSFHGGHGHDTLIRGGIVLTPSKHALSNH
jgi:RTX calcium-binding nonapeptide repeat (4 copies)